MNKPSVKVNRKTHNIHSGIFSKLSMFFGYTEIRGWVISCVISIAVCLFFFFYHVKDWYDAEGLCFYDRKPVMATFDAYYFMRLTEDYLSGGYDAYDFLRNAPRPRPVPLLVRIASLIKCITGFSTEYIAWLLPPLLASFTVFIYGYWARFFINPFLFVVASTIGSTSHVWFWRTSLGRFDTDSLNLFFPAILSASVFFTVTANGVYKKLAGFTVMLISILLWHMWWPQGHNIGFLLGLVTYGFSLFFVKSNRWENVLRASVLIGGILVAIAIATVHFLSKTLPIPDFLKPILDYMDLIFSKDSVDPSVGASITELKSVNLLQGTVQIFGHWALAFPALAGTIFTIIARPFFIILWAPFLMLGFMGLFSNRFLTFLVPPLAFGLAFFSSSWVIGFKRLSAILGEWKYIVALAMSIIFVIPNVSLNLKVDGIPNVTASLVHLAKIIEPMKPKDSPVWAWWDYGYLIQYYTKRRTFMDGGNQEALRIVIGAYPFSTEDVSAAKNWINSFSNSDLKPFFRAREELGDKVKAFGFLKEALKGKNSLKKVLSDYNQEHNEKTWQELLYPETRVFLFIPVDFFRKAYWWYYYGSWDYEKGHGRHPTAFYFHEWFVNVNPIKGYLTTLQGQKIAFGKYIILNKSQKIEEFSVSSKSSAVLLRTVPGVVFLFEESLSESVALKLYLRPNDFSNDFELIYYHPLYGGIWRTVPSD